MGEMLVRSKCAHLSATEHEKTSRVFMVTAKTGEGVNELHDAVKEKITSLKSNSTYMREKQKHRQTENLQLLLQEEVGERIWNKIKEDNQFEKLLSDLMERKIDPYSLIDQILKELEKSAKFREFHP